MLKKIQINTLYGNLKGFGVTCEQQCELWFCVPKQFSPIVTSDEQP